MLSRSMYKHDPQNREALLILHMKPGRDCPLCINLFLFEMIGVQAIKAPDSQGTGKHRGQDPKNMLEP